MSKETKSQPRPTASGIKSDSSATAVHNPTSEKRKKSRYINPLTDFGFKLIFGNKEYLIDFLNALLKIESGIVDLHYDNTERPGRSEDDRTTRFDLCCTLGTGERVLIEMQHYHHENFIDRTLYYASRTIQEQGEDKKGDREWEFELEPVFSVNIVDFKLDKRKKNRTPGKYITYGHLIDADTGDIISNKINFVYVELPYFVKEEHELPDYIDWWTYVIKNLVTLKHLPDAIRNRIFESLFHQAEIAKMSKEDRKEYDQSLKKLRNMNVAIAERDRKIVERDRRIAERDRRIADKDRRIAERDRKIVERDKGIAERDREIDVLSKEIADLKNQFGLN